MLIIMSKNIFLAGVFVLLVSSIFSCESYLDIGTPVSDIESEVVFSNDITATSALLGIYGVLADDGGFASGAPTSVLALTGLSGDELVNYSREVPMVEFERNTINPINENILTVWTSLYRSIYQVNSIIEGIDGSAGLSDSIRSQLKGEALFVRGFCYLYLVNLYGDVPLVVTTDYRTNAAIARTDANSIYAQIVRDLQSARGLLRDGYASYPNRTRPNKYAASALLARTYLYQEAWRDAELMASEVINNKGLYVLKDSLADVFLKNSLESIWELQPVVNGDMGYTNEAIYFSPDYVFSYNVLRPGIVDAYEPGDRRFRHWIDSIHLEDEILSLDTIFFFPRKYKQIDYGAALTEYSVMLRLAEQYLVRAEARAMQDNLSGENSAESDINIIRSRAGLQPVSDMTKIELLQAVLKERRLELMAEGGHRWFDLKRLGMMEDVLLTEKGDFEHTDQLYPLPAREFLSNPLLLRQNDGY